MKAQGHNHQRVGDGWTKKKLTVKAGFKSAIFCRAGAASVLKEEGGSTPRSSLTLGVLYLQVIWDSPVDPCRHLLLQAKIQRGDMDDILTSSQ